MRRNFNTLVVIPCFNEEHSILQTITLVQKKVNPREIWVINNSSTDNTANVAKAAGAVVYESPKKGKGFALRSAINRLPADVEFILMVDGDDTYGFDSFDQALNLVSKQGFDMVIGNRKSGNSINTPNIQRSDPYRAGHQIGNKALTFGFKLLFGLTIEDTLSGWRLMNVGFLKSFTGGAGGFELETELNVHAFALGANVTSVEVTYRGRHEGSSSKLNTYKDGWRILRKLVRLFLMERPRLAYSLLALPWLITGVGLLQRVLEVYFETGLVPNFPSLISSVGVFLVATLFWILGNVLENFRSMHRSLIRIAFIENS